MENIVIKVRNLNKIYRLYDKPIDRLKESLGITKKKYYKEYYALNDISFEIKKGEAVGIIGINGSGKSTLLKIITGVLSPSSGTIEVNGRISALLELGAGFNMEYTGLQNIYLNGTMMGFSKEEVSKKLPSIIEFADIGEFINQPVKTYSSGMFVRLAFAVAINIEPEILVVDEALSVGDVFFQAKCYKKFEEFKEAGKTILFVTHDLASVNKYCDRVILLNKGVKLDEGLPKDMIDLYKKLLVKGKNIQSNNLKENIKNNKVTFWKNLMPKNNKALNYGNDQVDIYDYCICDNKGMITNTCVMDEEFVVKMKVLFKADIENPIFAFTIKDLKGTELTGTNTLFENIETGICRKNTIKEIQFRQNMLLPKGEYLLSLGCTGYKGEDFIVYQRLYDICNIVVLADKNIVGFFNSHSTITYIGEDHGTD